MRLTVVIYRVAVSTISRCRNPGRAHQKHSHGLSFRSQLHGQECFWWTRGESNPRPTCLRFEGITTILAPREGIEPPTN